MRSKRPRPLATGNGVAANDNDRRIDIDRRSGADRREMPPRPEGRRRNGGRRTGDPMDA
ncbi:MAG: hypothetical protein JST00_42255 [Deltaproteobacteria bacterium]|nr:hypothetical protein [Deltaproteobacteria bacterium]